VTVTIYHNPACGTSRNALAMLRAAGIEPVIVDYLKTPPSRRALKAIVKATDGPLRALLREKDTPFAEIGLGDPKWSDDELLDFIAQHPILLNQPIVVSPKGTALCRPSEKVLDLLPDGAVAAFVKEDGKSLGEPN
jgi:arsenate reductase (glutaredoxin)